MWVCIVLEKQLDHFQGDFDIIAYIAKWCIFACLVISMFNWFGSALCTGTWYNKSGRFLCLSIFQQRKRPLLLYMYQVPVHCVQKQFKHFNSNIFISIYHIQSRLSYLFQKQLDHFMSNTVSKTRTLSLAHIQWNGLPLSSSISLRGFGFTLCFKNCFNILMSLYVILLSSVLQYK